MKRSYKKIICLLLGVMILTLGQSVSCSAWGPSKAEDEEKFLDWYEKHKNDNDAVYTLTGDLTLTKGTEQDPIRFDGSGKVRISCGAHGIIANSKVIIDNPNLTISGEYMFVLMENSEDSDLMLKRGTILDESDYACAVQIIHGSLKTSSDPSDRFTIQIKGRDISGIYNGADEPLILKQLDIRAEGTGRVEGIKNYINQNVSLTDCNLNVSSDQEAWGVSNQGKTEVNRCRITASVSDPFGTAVSAAGSEVSSRDSKLVPEITGIENTVYSIYDIDSMFPVIGRTAADLKSLLPGDASVYVENTQTKEKSIISVPVIWDVSVLDTSKAGITIVEGRLLTNGLFGIYINSSGVSPKAAVIAVPPEGMFLNSYKILSKTEGKMKGMLELPYPVGADSMILQYSEDQKKWNTYTEEDGNANLIKDQDFTKPFGVFSFVFDIPVCTNTFYMRTKVQGDSIFSGTSAVWKMDGDHGSSGSSVSGESGGDRGGQTVDQEKETTDKEQKKEGRNKNSESSVSHNKKKKALDKESGRIRNTKKEGSIRQQGSKKGNGRNKKTSAKVGGEKKQEQGAELSEEARRKKENKNKGNFAFAAAGSLLVLGFAVLLGRKFFCQNEL